MRVSYNWLREYVELDLSPEELAEKMTMAGIEVDGVEYLAEGISKVVVGQILDIKPHPNADKLVVCTIDAGTYGQNLSVVTGAPNIKEGLKVPLALEGASLPGGMEINRVNFRGTVSLGMICSAQELNLDSSLIDPQQREGVLILSEEAVPGTSVTEFLGLEDYVLELDLTPNRSDCLSMVNVAREVAAITSAVLHIPPEEQDWLTGELDFQVEIQAEDLCGRYVALGVEDICLKPSPSWMQQRLVAAGMRPINNIVDITNYVMLEMGQPLHAFDFDTLEGRKIIVRRSRPGEKLLTLDGTLRNLDPEMLVIADSHRPVALAGVMGGLETEITSKTCSLLLESAYFDNVSIRKTSRILGLRSEASNRFEKGVNREGALPAAIRAVRLMEELGAGKPMPGKIDVYPRPWSQQKVSIRTERANQILGTDLSTETIKSLLQQLQFQITEEKCERITVAAPAYREDITSEIDLIEEVARLYGYNRIPLTIPKGEAKADRQTPLQELIQICLEVMTNCGLTQVINYSFINPQLIERLGLPSQHPWHQFIRLANPLSEEQSVMRTTLIPGMLNTALKNLNRRVTDLGIFEIGRIYLPSGDLGKLPEEREMLTGLVSGKHSPGWKWADQDLDFFLLKGVAQTLIRQVTGREPGFISLTDHPVYHPGRSARILVDHIQIGEIGELHPDVQDSFALKQRVCLLNIDLMVLEQFAGKSHRYEPLARFPSIDRDMAVVVPEFVSAEEIGAIIENVGGGLVGKFELFDVYRGPQVPEKYKSLAYSLTYQARDRTLTDEEVNVTHEKIKEALRQGLQAEFR